jgi:hypothetical protein
MELLNSGQQYLGTIMHKLCIFRDLYTIFSYKPFMGYALEIFIIYV